MSPWQEQHPLPGCSIPSLISPLGAVPGRAGHLTMMSNSKESGNITNLALTTESQIKHTAGSILITSLIGCPPVENMYVVDRGPVSNNGSLPKHHRKVYKRLFFQPGTFCSGHITSRSIAGTGPKIYAQYPSGPRTTYCILSNTKCNNHPPVPVSFMNVLQLLLDDHAPPASPPWFRPEMPRIHCGETPPLYFGATTTCLCI